MSARMERTRHPGIYKRGSRYVVTYRVAGKQKREAVRTLEEARKLKAARHADIARGEFQEATRLTFREYALEWVQRYQGRGRGFRESTRGEYRRLLENYAIPYFDERLPRRTLSQITPRDVSNFIGWLCDEREQARHQYELDRQEAHEVSRRTGNRFREPKRPEAKRLSDSTVRNILNPVRACMATATTEGLVRHNPTARAALPHRPREEDLERETVRVLTRDQLAAFLNHVDPRHRLMFRLLASTGVRVGELIAIQWRHLKLDGSSPHLAVRREIYKNRVQAPKSRHGRREVPLEPGLVSALRQHRKDTEWPGDEDLVFPSLTGTPLSPGNVRRRTLKPVAEEVGAPWTGFHTFRHTCASILFERGANAKQVQRWLGHHSASFTLDRYVHLLSDDLGEPLRLATELEVTTERQRDPAETGRNAEDPRTSTTAS